MHHNMSSNDVCDEAQARLIEIERYANSLFRFRLGGKPRLWGERNVDKFEILWFDPTHSVYPVGDD
ncbi:hypothetical protein BMI91_17000 [Thioclava sediminum]|uniref:Uncharacterized protein n=2 Tax=Thioclava sediminum TaxID=1915319 RepID=A0ABX3MTX6_9RHOB|nr:hypothetical protein BMI91_17000 [Thioclava sediminum]